MYNKNIIKLFAGGRPRRFGADVENARAPKTYSQGRPGPDEFTYTHTNTELMKPIHYVSVRFDVFVYKEKLAKLRLIGYSLSYWNNCQPGSGLGGTIGWQRWYCMCANGLRTYIAELSTINRKVQNRLEGVHKLTIGSANRETADNEKRVYY